MKIAFLTGSVSAKGGGVHEAVRRLAIEQSQGGHFRVEVFGIGDDRSPVDEAAWQLVPVRALPVSGPRTFGYAPQLSPALNASQPDLVHQHGIWMYPSVVCRRWSRRTRKPALISPHGMLDTWALRNAAWKKRLAAWCYENRNMRQAACLHALCESEARAIRGLGLANPICIIPNGVDLPDVAAASSPDFEYMGKQDAKVLLYLGRLHPKKNLVNLLRAWAQCQKSRAARDWRLVIAGWDQDGYLAVLERARQEFGLSDSVTFPGPQFGAAKESTFRRAAAFVLPSLSEGLPVAVLEAWAYGLPVLMTSECNLPEGVAAGAALPVGPDPASIAAGLLDLFRMNDTELKTMGNHGRELVRNRFAWARISEQMRQVYAWTLGGGLAPDDCMAN